MQNKTAFVFPGQGSQFVGMLDPITNSHPQTAELLAEASDVVGYDVAGLIAEGPESRLNQTEYTQVAMLVSDVAFFKLLQEKSELTPVGMAGHSLGEYAALVCANSLSFRAAVHLVSRRGQLMQSTVPSGQGAMAAIIGLDDAVVESICLSSSKGGAQVSAANYNSPGQIVIAGHVAAVASAIAAAEKEGAIMARQLAVSVPCHCPLLETTAACFREELEKTAFERPSCTVLSNIDAAPYQDAEDIRMRLVQQLYQPVQWVKTIQQFACDGYDHFIECGPGKTLTGLIKRIDRGLRAEAAVRYLDV